MIRPPAGIRRATAGEMPHAVAAIVAAFLVDPTARFAWPAARAYLEAMPLAIHAFAGTCVEHGTAFISADFCGAALWLPPGVQPNGEALEKIFRDTAAPEHLDDLLATFEKMDESHPNEAHWYLSMIGVDPQAQGKGLGAALLHDSLARCDHDGALAHLETANARNIALYERFGFEAMEPFQIGAAPRVTPMLRRPR